MNSDNLQIVILNLVIVSPIDVEEASKTTASYASFFFVHQEWLLTRELTVYLLLRADISSVWLLAFKKSFALHVTKSQLRIMV